MDALDPDTVLLVNTMALGAFVFTTLITLVPLLLTLISYRYAGMW